MLLTLFLFGPVVPLDMAILLAGTLLGVAGMAGNRDIRAVAFAKAKAEWRAVASRLRRTQSLNSRR